MFSLFFVSSRHDTTLNAFQGGYGGRDRYDDSPRDRMRGYRDYRGYGGGGRYNDSRGGGWDRRRDDGYCE